MCSGMGKHVRILMCSFHKSLGGLGKKSSEIKLSEGLSVSELEILTESRLQM